MIWGDSIALSLLVIEEVAGIDGINTEMSKFSRGAGCL